MRFQDDFYEAVNGEWIKRAVIPEDKPRTGGYSDLVDSIERLMLDTTKDWLEGGNLPVNPILINFIEFHRMVSNYHQRDLLGVDPVKPIIEEYKELSSFREFTSRLADYTLKGKPNKFPFGIAPDFMNAQLNVLWGMAPELILPDTSYYEEDNEQGKELHQVWRKNQEELFLKFGFSISETEDILDKVLILDKKLAKYVLSSQELSEFSTLYHNYSWEDFKLLAPELPLDEILVSILGEIPDKIIVPEERFWVNYASEYYSETNWDYLKASLILEVVKTYSPYLTNDIRVLSGAFGRTLSGTPQAMDPQKAAYHLASEPFNQAIGLWYTSEHFSSEAKADVETKVKTMINVYKKRLSCLEWLSSATRQRAITKLEQMVPLIGYPEKLPSTYNQKIINKNLSLIENVQNLIKVDNDYMWKKWNKPVDRNEWHMPAHMVNAYYDPQQNQIVFPAAILQAPFYDINQTASANYGGIGAVIAHEISHAFDTNGSFFDENGSLSDWWTPADYKAFDIRIKKVINQFEGVESYGAKISGQLTVSENVADLGGLACALEAAKKELDFSAKEFFINFATIWRMKARKEYVQMLASIDVHAPGNLRTNIILSNFEEFHKTFGVIPTDLMWRSEDDRVTIW